MTKDTRTRVIVGIIGVVVVLAIATQVRKGKSKTIRQIEGKITAVDVVTRTASIEFVHPKSGQVHEISSYVPPNCEIMIDGQPGEMADIQVGEMVRAEGAIGRDNEVSVKRVWVSRKGAATQPAATRPAGAS